MLTNDSQALHKSITAQIAPIDETYKLKLHALIPENKTPKISALACQKRANEFYTGRWCAAMCIYKITNGFNTPQINQDRSPQWPPNIIGSISHSNKTAIAIVGCTDNTLALGVDIQSQIEKKEIFEIKHLILSSIELKRYPDLFRDQLFDIFFSAKETLFKALYPLSLDFFEHKDAEIVSINKSSSTLNIKLLRNLKSSWNRDQIFTIKYSKIANEVVTWLFIENY